MEIALLRGPEGLGEALLGIGLNFGLTSEARSWDEAGAQTQERIMKVAANLAVRGGGEDKFLRQVCYWYSVDAPRYLWQEISTYKVATVEQSESTMHSIMKTGRFEQSMFEYPVPESVLAALNAYLEDYRAAKSDETFFRLKNELPEGFLQRRVWSLSLAQMKNVYRQRHAHIVQRCAQRQRLPLARLEHGLWLECDRLPRPLFFPQHRQRLESGPQRRQVLQ